MTQVISMVTPSQAMTPARSPMEVDDYDGPRGFRAVPNTPDSPSPRTAGLARKRAASINTVDANYGRLERLKLNTPTSMTSEGPRDICLCTPAPKIPRPRNAFILYRQHHQAQVVAQNPNLSNPDISKIIGEQWKEEAEEVKNTWKSLADEEKQRHQRQYPDYRYQPRRGNKAQGNRPGSSSADDSGRCPKCNGRSIATPRTPSTPFPTPTTAKPVVNPYTPTVRGDDPDLARRGSYGNLPATRLHYTPQRPSYREVDDYDPESPELKRRRFNMSGGYHTVSPPAQGVRALSMGAPPRALRQYPATPLPEPGLPRSKSGPMPPPPRPAISGPWPEQGHHVRHASYDESLRLPPLQTSVPMSPTTATEVDIRQINTPVTGLGITNARDPQARSVEAMVMSIPFTRKLSVLARINQTPITAFSPASPGVENRGAVIAVEGPKLRMLKQVGQVVERALLASTDVALKTWGRGQDLEPDTGDRRGSQSEERKDTFTSCFESMVQWHQNSRDIAKHIINNTEDSTKDATMEKDIELRRSRRISTEGTSSEVSQDKRLVSKVPVALLKEGFSLTLSDTFACAVPINDAYAPIDHWQWMATLWRGTIASDLVIYVKPSVEEEIAKCGTVDFQKHPALMVVRIAVGKDLDEATERRVAFEVVEWVRGGSFREENGRI